MARTDSVRRALLAKVHVAAKQCGLDEAARRDFIAQVTGHRSLRDCSNADIETVLAGFGRVHGWRPAPRNRRAAAASEAGGKIRALWTSLVMLNAVRDPSDAALLKFVRRVTKKKRPASVDALRFLSGKEEASVIEALKGWLERAGVDWDLSRHSAFRGIFPSARVPVLVALWYRGKWHLDEDGLIPFARRTFGISDWEGLPEPKISGYECDRLMRILADRIRTTDAAAAQERDHG